jgi:hypothetical protein
VTAIIVNHLTRVRDGRICVAGIELDSREHLRPVTVESNFLDRSALATEGGPFEIGALIELGETDPHPDPPQTENHRFSLERVEPAFRLKETEYLELLEPLCRDTLREAFGPALRRVQPSCAAPEGEGERSLACVRLPARARLRIDPDSSRLRLYLPDPELPATLPVADLRFVEPDHLTLRTDAIDTVAAALQHGEPAIAMLGLGGAWSPSPDYPAMHWLQVNGICLRERPFDELG